MHHLTCGISSLLHSVNINILFTLLLVHLILRITSSQPPSFALSNKSWFSVLLSLPRPFIPDLKLISFTNPFLHSLSDSFCTAFTVTDLELGRDLVDNDIISFFFYVSGFCWRMLD